MNSIECPQCGAPVALQQKRCEYCKAEFFINSISYLSGFDNTGIQKYLKYYKSLVETSPDNPNSNLGLGICYLQMRMYTLAQQSFEIVIKHSPEIASAYYYCSLARIAGRRVMYMDFDEVETIVHYLQTAIQLDSKTLLYPLLLMLIIHDFYIQNSFKEPEPGYEELYNITNGAKFDRAELARLKACVKITDFSEFGL